MMDSFVGEGDTDGRKAVRATVPMGRMATPDEQADPIMVLCSRGGEPHETLRGGRRRRVSGTLSRNA